MYCFSSLEEFAVLREPIKGQLLQSLGEDALHTFIAINEGVNNAIFHGNKEDRSKKVYLIMEESLHEVKIIIRDEGDGYRKEEITAATDDFREDGRGFALIQYCVDSYQCNALGNEIILIKKRRIV